MDDRERKIRDRAYAIWEREGRPQGRESEHWRQAEREVDDAPGAAAGEAGTAGKGSGSARKAAASGQKAAAAGAGPRKAAAGARKPTAAKPKAAGTEKRPGARKTKKTEE